MFARSSTRRCLIALVVLLVAGCGGGGGENGNGGTGDGGGGGDNSSTLAKLNEDSANLAAEAFMAQLQVAREIWRRMPPSFSSRSIHEDWHSLPGYGGAAKLTGVIDTESPQSRLDVEFRDYVFLGMPGRSRLAINGNAILSINYSQPSAMALNDTTLGYKSGYFTLSGSVNLGSPQITANLAAEKDGESWGGELHIALERGDNYNDVSVTSVSGRVTLPDNTYAEIDTLENGKAFRLRGDGDLVAIADLTDERIGTLNLDVNGDGIVEKARRFTWNDNGIDWSSGGLRKLPIAVAQFPFDKWHGTAPQLGEPQQLDGTLSVGKPGEFLSYSWETWLKPPDSKMTLEHADSAKPRFVPDVPGSYIFALRAKSTEGSALDIVDVYVGPDGKAWWGVTSPSLGTPFSARVGDMVMVGQPLGNETISLDRPEGSNATSDYRNSQVSFVPDVEGIYELSGSLEGSRISVKVGGDSVLYSRAFVTNQCVLYSADFDGDGKDDRIIYREDPAQRELVLASDPDNSQLFDPNLTKMSDLDGDGKLEAVQQHPSEWQVMLHYLDDSNTIQEVNEPFPYDATARKPHPFLIQLPDGTPLVFVSTPYDAEPHREWRWTGDALEATSLVADPTPFNSRFVQLDFNGDGYMDVVSRATNSGNLDLWEGKADNTFELVTSAWVEDGHMVADDLDGDGRDELLRMRSTGVFLYRNLDTEDFTDVRSIYPRWYGRWLQVHDINDDGRLDLAFVTNSAPSSRTILLYQEDDGSFRSEEYTLGHVFDPSQELTWADENGDDIQDMIHCNTISYGLDSGGE